MKNINNKNILVTGGSGFLGEELIERIYRHSPKMVRVISRNEGKLIMLKHRFPKIEVFPGDISNAFDMKQASVGINTCFHLAAFKHVGMAEDFSMECIRTNIVGTGNVLEESLKNTFELVVGISTDKAAQVSGVYGASKLLLEKMFKQYEKLNPSTEYRVVRYGNVLYSTGSVLCKWKDLLSRNQEVIITDPDATRFFWTREQAIDLIFTCITEANDCTPWIPTMKAMAVGDLLQAMAQKYLPAGGTLKVKTIGLQPGENFHETMHENGPYSSQVEKFSIEEIVELI